jgi:lysophospholipase L1-like esterase
MALFTITNSNATVFGRISLDSLYGDIIGLSGRTIIFSFTGTALNLYFQQDYPGSGKGLDIKIDGGSVTTYAQAGANYNTITPIVSGLSDTTHTVEIDLDGGSGGGGNVKFKPSSHLEVLGASPSIQYAASLDTYGYGQAYSFSDSARDAFRLGPRLSLVGDSLSGESIAAGYNGGYQVALKTNATGLWIYYSDTGGGTARCTLYDQNGDIVGSGSVAAFQKGKRVYIATGSTTLKEYTLGFNAPYVAAVSALGGTLSSGGSKPATRKIWSVTGTSITVSADATAWTPEVASAHTPLRIGGNLSELYFADPMGVGGSTLIDHGGGTNATGEERLAEIIALNPNFLIMEHACNDIGYGTSAATFQSALITYLNSLFTGATNLEKVYLAPFWTGYQYSADGTAYVAAHAAAAASVNATLGSTKVYFISTASFRDTVTLYDGVHPDRTGAATISDALADLIAPAASITPGTITEVGTSTTSSSLSVTAGSGGTSPYTNQWHRSTTTGFTPGSGTAISGATSLTLNDTGLTPNTTYYYKVVQTDAASLSGTTTQEPVTTPNYVSNAGQGRSRLLGRTRGI